MKIGLPKFFREKQNRKTPEELLVEAEQFAVRGEYAAAIGCFQKLSADKKVDRTMLAEKFIQVWMKIESNAIAGMGSSLKDRMIEPTDFITEGEIAMNNLELVQNINTEFGIQGLMLPKDLDEHILTPETLGRIRRDFLLNLHERKKRKNNMSWRPEVLTNPRPLDRGELIKTETYDDRGDTGVVIRTQYFKDPSKNGGFIEIVRGIQVIK